MTDAENTIKELARQLDAAKARISSLADTNADLQAALATARADRDEWKSRAGSAEAREAALLAGNQAVWDDGYRIASEIDALRAEIKLLRKQVVAAEAAALERAADQVASNVAHLNFTALLHTMREDPLPAEIIDPLSDWMCAISTAIRAMITTDAAAALEAVKEDARMEAVKVTPLVWQELPKAGYTAFDDVFKECVYADTDDEKRSIENVRTARIRAALAWKGGAE